MENNAIRNSITKKMLKLPKKIITNKNNLSLAECILYELSEELFSYAENISYFVYNPDYNICKGIAGLSHEDISLWQGDPWSNVENFSKTIKAASFNKKIIETAFCTISHKSVDFVIEEIKKSLEMPELLFFILERKYNNIGILFYKPTVKEFSLDSEIEDLAGILSFCPVTN